MAHELDFSTGTAAIALVGKPAWHGYGNILQPGVSIEEWRAAAGLGFDLIESPVFTRRQGTDFPVSVPDYKAISRHDTGDTLLVVSSRYHVVQPAECLEFFRDLTEKHGYELETAGALRGGRRFWALAKTGRTAFLLGQDEIRDYLLLSSSCDGSLATTAQYTSIRVVCNNTLSYAVEAGEVGGANAKARKVRVQHSRKFDAANVKGELAASNDHWAAFIARSESFARKGVTVDQAVRYFTKLLDIGETVNAADQRKLERHMNEWTAGLGADMDSARRSVWGLVNAVTHQVDHGSKERIEGSRLNQAWFGPGAYLKARAVRQAEELIAA